MGVNWGRGSRGKGATVVVVAALPSRVSSDQDQAQMCVAVSSSFNINKNILVDIKLSTELFQTLKARLLRFFVYFLIKIRPLQHLFIFLKK